jgi:cytochrome c
MKFLAFVFAMLTGALALLATTVAPERVEAGPVVGDPAHGEQLFVRCTACHTIAAGAPNRIGPNLHGLFERGVARAPGFHYSASLQAQSFQWDDARLDRWLTNPRAMAPGTSMVLQTPSATDRRDLIAYLRKAAR